MAVTVRYQRPTVSPVVKLAAVRAAAVHAGADILLAASQPFVPVDTGELKASGAVDMVGPETARVSYQRTAPDGFNVAIHIHEDATLNHPGGGTDHYLSKPARSEGDAIIAAEAVIVRAGLAL